MNLRKKQGFKECQRCFESADLEQKGHGKECREYAHQVAFTKRVMGWLSKEPVQTVPASPDYSTPQAVTARCREAGTLEPMERTTYTLLDGHGRAYRLFAAALERVTTVPLAVAA